MPRLVFPIAVLALPLLELYLLLRVGQALGALPTMLLLGVSAFAGVLVMRHYGMASMARVRGALARGQSPAEPILDAFLALIAGGLLALPGFGSDAIALCLLIRPLRRRLARRLWAPANAPADERIIEGEFRSRDQDRLP